MPTRNHRSGKPWRARIRRHGRDFHLGVFDTQEEALEVEQKARNKYPSRVGVNLAYGLDRSDGVPGFHIGRDERGRYIDKS